MSEANLGSIVLYDEDENEIEFDIMDKFGLDGETYYVLLHIDYDRELPPPLAPGAPHCISWQF